MLSRIIPFQKTISTRSIVRSGRSLTIRSRGIGIEVGTGGKHSSGISLSVTRQIRNYTSNCDPPPKAMSTKPASPPSTPENNSHDTRNLSPLEKHQVHVNRMDRPPYSLPDNTSPSDFKQVYTGSCFCNQVKFAISREKPLDSKYCHCKGCQVLHGAPFQWAAIFEKTDMHFYEGKDQLIYWNTSEQSTEYILPCKVYCNHCRAPIMDEGRNMLLMFPTLIHFKDVKEKERFKPSCHIFYSKRVIDIPDGIPKWEGHKDESRQIPETERLPSNRL